MTLRKNCLTDSSIFTSSRPLWSELNLGHMIHAADNFRGSFRGLGAELRTDAYGAVRAGAGRLVSSYKVNHSAAARNPAGENSDGIALLKQAAKLAETFSSAAVTHQTVRLAAHAGASNANASVLDGKAAPLQATLVAMSAMVGNVLTRRLQTRVRRSLIPAMASCRSLAIRLSRLQPRVVLELNAGKSLQLANCETVMLMSGQDTQFITGGQVRIQAGQTIGVLAGAVKVGEGGVGMQLVAAKDAIDIQAQGDELKVQARDDVDVISANAHIDWAAAKSISCRRPTARISPSLGEISLCSVRGR